MLLLQVVSGRYAPWAALQVPILELIHGLRAAKTYLVDRIDHLKAAGRVDGDLTTQSLGAMDIAYEAALSCRERTMASGVHDLENLHHKQVCTCDQLLVINCHQQSDGSVPCITAGLHQQAAIRALV